MNAHDNLLKSLKEFLDSSNLIEQVDSSKEIKTKTDKHRTFMFETSRIGDYRFGLNIYDDGDAQIFAKLNLNSEKNQFDFWYITYEKIDYDSGIEFTQNLFNDIKCILEHDTKIVVNNGFFTISFDCYYFNCEAWVLLKSNSYFRFGNFNFPPKKLYKLTTASQAE